MGLINQTPTINVDLMNRATTYEPYLLLLLNVFLLIILSWFDKSKPCRIESVGLMDQVPTLNLGLINQTPTILTLLHQFWLRDAHERKSGLEHLSDVIDG